MQAQLEDIEKNGDIALTDPDSKMMLVKNSGREVSQKVEIAEELGVSELTVIADKGYYSAKQFMLCEEAGTSVIAPKPTLQSAPDERYAKGKFVYDKNLDAYICPKAIVLTHVKKRLTSKREEENYTNPSACRPCAVREPCTKSPYRTIQDPKCQRFADRVDARTAQN